MSDVIGEKFDVRIEVELSGPNKGVMLVFDKKTDYHVVPWQDAFTLAETMEQMIKDVGDQFGVDRIVNWPKIWREQAQIKLCQYKDLVCLLTDWNDRFKFTKLEALFLVARALRLCAQDAHLERVKGVKILYNKQGLISRIHNMRNDVTQFVR
jgi:hypothetical protein